MCQLCLAALAHLMKVLLKHNAFGTDKQTVFWFTDYFYNEHTDGCHTNLQRFDFG